MDKKKLLCKYDRRRLTADRRKTFSSLVVRRQARDDSSENRN
jgi:hypothetical protein